MQRKYKSKQILIVLCIFVCSLSLVVTFARYVTGNISNFFIKSKEFYFYSDKLKSNEAIYQIDNWSGVDDYTIVVNMNSYENNLKYTTYDIAYNVEAICSSNAICQISKTEGVIYADKKSDTFYVIITPNANLDTGDKVVVEISATSTTGYEKTLKGRFTLVVGKENLSYEITDKAQSNYMDVRITNTKSFYVVDTAFDTYSVGDKIDIDTYLSLSNENKNKCYSSIVTISFNPKQVLLDMTSKEYQLATDIKTIQIDGKQYINGFTLRVDASSSVNIRFYKEDVTQDYTYPLVNDQSIIEVTSI